MKCRKLKKLRLLTQQVRMKRAQQLLIDDSVPSPFPGVLRLEGSATKNYGVEGEPSSERRVNTVAAENTSDDDDRSSEAAS